MQSKKSNLSGKVMNKIVSFERKRSVRILVQIFGIVILLFSVSVFFLYLTARDILEQKSFELLTLFGEDFEIIKSYWRDTLSIFWEELPQEKILIFAATLIIGIIVIFVFWKRIKLVVKKLRTLAKLKF